MSLNRLAYLQLSTLDLARYHQLVYGLKIGKINVDSEFDCLLEKYYKLKLNPSVFGRKSSFTIARNGDFINKMYLQCTLPGINPLMNNKNFFSKQRKHKSKRRR